jgi:hypothetical protein
VRGDNHWTLQQGLLLHDKRLVVPDVGDLRVRLLDEVHRQLSTAHPGCTKTYQLMQPRYYWRGMMRDVGQYVRNCRDCRRANTPRDLPPGTLKPLPIPIRPWQHVSIDFCSFPKDREGYDAIFMIVNQLTKRSVSIPCFKTTGAREMAQLYVDRIYRWKGAPESIISNRGGQFISEF